MMEAVFFKTCPCKSVPLLIAVLPVVEVKIGFAGEGRLIAGRGGKSKGLSSEASVENIPLLVPMGLDCTVIPPELAFA